MAARRNNGMATQSDLLKDVTRRSVNVLKGKMARYQSMGKCQGRFHQRKLHADSRLPQKPRHTLTNAAACEAQRWRIGDVRRARSSVTRGASAGPSGAAVPGHHLAGKRSYRRYINSKLRNHQKQNNRQTQRRPRGPHTQHYVLGLSVSLCAERSSPLQAMVAGSPLYVPPTHATTHHHTLEVLFIAKRNA